MGPSLPLLMVSGQQVAAEINHAVQVIRQTMGRGLHSSTFQLNLSALYGIGVARRNCVARVKGVLGDVEGV